MSKLNNYIILVHPLGFSQPVPLVPLTEANEEAMDNKHFKKLLRKLGLRAPANEQVCFSSFFVFCVNFTTNICSIMCFLFVWLSLMRKNEVQCSSYFMHQLIKVIFHW